MELNNPLEIPRIRRQTNYFNLVEGGTQRYLNRCTIKRLLIPAMDYCNSIGLKIESLNIKEAENDNVNIDNIELVINELNNAQATDQTNDKKIKAFKALIGKDYGNFSDKSYRNFRKCADFVILPTIDEVIEVRHEIDDKLYQIHENEIQNGFYNDPMEKIKKVCSIFVRDQNGSIRNDTIVLKLGGDGTSLTKSNTKILNLAFTVINDYKTAKSVKGNYCIGMKIFFLMSFKINLGKIIIILIIV
jgi:hypothetical protein